MTTAHAGWWRQEGRVQRPTANVSGGGCAVATGVLWCNRPLANQVRLFEPEAVGCP
jgi:hypothetical protein